MKYTSIVLAALALSGCSVESEPSHTSLSDITGIPRCMTPVAPADRPLFGPGVKYYHEPSLRAIYSKLTHPYWAKTSAVDLHPIDRSGQTLFYTISGKTTLGQPRTDLFMVSINPATCATNFIQIIGE